MKPLACVDFETKAINGALPPVPVGVAILLPKQRPFYLAWGHASDNNCNKEKAVRILKDVFETHDVLFHNSQFDLAVAKYHLGIDYPSTVHDTLFLLFLRNPHAKTLSLKPCADEVLGWAPDEQQTLYSWIIANVKNATHKNAGAFISEAPGSMVEPYAIGDVERTLALFNELYPKYKGEAYTRECKLVKILTDNTLRGVRLNLHRLSKDFEYYSDVKNTVDNRIYLLLGSRFNIDSSEELANAISKSNINVNWVLTPTGKRSTSKPNLIKAISNEPILLGLLNYRSTLATYLETFFTSWLDKQVDSRIHFTWNQVRNQEQEKKGLMGTRTGRLSSVPSMLNVPGTPPEYNPELDLPPLPHMRSYLIADEGLVWLKRDYSQQELRVLAHYEDGMLMEAYAKNPSLDMHTFMSEVLSNTTGRPISRKTTKNMAFGLLYGMGLALLAEKMECSYEEAATIKKLYLNAVPGIRSVQSAIKDKWSNGLPFKTFGGRLYYKEESKMVVDKATGLPRLQDFIYKGLNYLIQGSSADITKQAIINYSELSRSGFYQIAVHDEINIQGPVEEMKLLKEAMTDLPLDVELLSEGFMGQSYGELQDFVEA